MNEHPMTPRCMHCGWSRADHGTRWAWACAEYEEVESFTGPFAPEVERVLAQALRLIRDSTDGYAANVARRALAEASVPDPPDEGWMLHGRYARSVSDKDRRSDRICCAGGPVDGHAVDCMTLTRFVSDNPKETR